VSSRDDILDAATTIFADKGFDATSVREICATAGVNIAAVNYHFGSKAGLYREAVLRAYHQASQSAMPTLDTADGDADAALASWIHWYAVRCVRPGRDAASRLMLREAAQPSEALTGVVESVLHPVYRELEEIVRALLPASTDARVLKIQCLSIIGQCLVHRVCREMIDRLPVEPALGPDDASAIAELVLANARAALSAASTSILESTS
jgi:AcrR family transcriptional regulator